MGNRSTGAVGTGGDLDERASAPASTARAPDVGTRAPRAQPADHAQRRRTAPQDGGEQTPANPSSRPKRGRKKRRSSPKAKHSKTVATENTLASERSSDVNGHGPNVATIGAAATDPSPRSGSIDANVVLNSAAVGPANTDSERRPTRSGARSSGRPARGGTPSYAALDLGTNNCRLLIATPLRGGRFKVVDSFSRIVRLGQGLGRSNRLDDDAMERTLTALRLCAAKMNGRPIRRRRMIATEACRRALNGSKFINRVSAETGLKLEIIDRRTEAHLAVAGCASLIDRQARGVVLFDIGGGSTEVALLDLTGPRERPASRSIAAWNSFPVGVVTLSERYGGRVVTPDLFDEMVDYVTELLATFGGRHRLKRFVGTRHFHLLGTSGTVTTLAGLHLELPHYDRRRVDGLWMHAEALDRVQGKLLESTFEERRASPCIGTERADLVLAGCAILEAIRRMWPSERLRVADRGLREGMLSDMMVSDDAWSRIPGRGR